MSRYLVDAYWESLMDHPVAGGGHGSGGGKSKRPKPGGAREHNEPLDEPEEVYVPRYRVRGLTPGEQWYYDTRPGLAGELLSELVATIMAGYLAPISLPEIRGVKRNLDRDNFAIYSLDDIEIARLNTYPGLARAHLATIARARGGGRVTAIDVSAAHRARRAA